MSVSPWRRRAKWLYHQPDSTVRLAHDLADELAQRWNDGERPETEEYLNRFPQLAGRADAALELIYEEICQQREAGKDPRPSVWLQRFPQWRPQIEMMLGCHEVRRSGGKNPPFPKPGESFGEFQLLDQFGEGAHGRVYLARQPSLADRPVVLKLASLSGKEHISLARLQHTYIMPIYWAHDDVELGLRALCMPYFGGASLAQLLSRLEDVPPAKRTGRDLLQALEAASEHQRLAPPVQGPACRVFEKATYVEAICTLGACLAEALDYAHQRNVVHHDLKPSNVLIAADAQPLLLDFHLAQPMLEAGSVSVAWLGGTPGYMAPEHEVALAAIEARQPIPQRVDGRADIFSLGMLLFEALAGAPPPSHEAPARALRRANGQVGPALADLLAKCMAVDPAQRYPDAGALAADLHRHLAHLPLKHVANRSLAERWRKWRRRRPYSLMGSFLGIALVTSCLVTASNMRQRWQEAERALDEAEMEIEAGHFQWATVAIERGLFLAEELPLADVLWRDLQAARAVAQQGYLVQQLHSVVDQTRGAYREDGSPRSDVSRLESEVRRLWDQRHVILDARTSHHNWSRAQAKEDMIELAIFWAEANLRHADDNNRREAAHDGLQVLLYVERLAGSKYVLCQKQCELATLAESRDVAAHAADKLESLKPAAGWEYYALGRSAFRAGHFDEAEAHFKMAVESKPKELWFNFYQGRAAYELKWYDEAATAFTICVALADQTGWCYYHRGLAAARLGRAASARRDFDRALELDPLQPGPALERGMLSYQERHYDDAIADFERASSNGADQANVAYALALAYAAMGDRSMALDRLDALFALKPNHADGQKLAQSLRGATE
ncbi:MAG TPA: serine/threonine-protein kinase [Pirellulales bacterium]|nr:serine/threonine-protein kinase [Pirellulales bacterium]